MDGSCMVTMTVRAPSAVENFGTICGSTVCPRKSVPHGGNYAVVRCFKDDNIYRL